MIQLVVPGEAAPGLAAHLVVSLHHLIAVLRRGADAPFALQVGLAHPDPELPGVGGVVAEHQVAVGVKAGGPAAEGLGPVGVREHVVAVAVALQHRQGRVGAHPENQVGELAEPAAHAGLHRAVDQHHAGQVAPPTAGPPDQIPVTEHLPGPQQQPVQPRRGQAEVGDLVVLHPHVRVFQLPEQGRVVGKAQAGEGRFLPLPGKAAAHPQPEQLPPHAKDQPPRRQTEGGAVLGLFHDRVWHGGFLLVSQGFLSI